MVAPEPDTARARRDALRSALRRPGPPLLWDGGMGTGLIARGLELATAPPEAWLLDAPDQVRAVHTEFVEAGVDVLQTNTFGLVRLRHGGQPAPPEPIERLLERALELARNAASTTGAAEAPHVVVSLGPAGKPGLDPGALAATYGELAALSEARGASGLHLETCLEPIELRAALRGIAEAAPELPLLVSLTLSMGQFGLETPLGTPLARMLGEIDRSPIAPVAVGANCSQPARRMGPTLAALRQWADPTLPLLAQPQIDQPAPDCKRPPAPETPERFARDLLQLLDDGATALGGCCGARGPHLRAVREAIALLFSRAPTV